MSQKPSGKMNQYWELAEAGLTGLMIERQEGQELIAGERRYIDYSSTNYLRFDLRPELHERGCQRALEWGNLTGWSRLEVDIPMYPELEARLGRLLGAREVIVGHTITALNYSLIPIITAKGGIILADEKVHTVVWEACRLARDHGSALERFRHQDLEDLERLLKRCPPGQTKLVAVDGVYSLSTEHAPIRELQALCERYEAWLYVDDAHGFGILGARPTPRRPYGQGGGGLLQHVGGDLDRTFYVSSLGKAFCSMTAFCALPRLYPQSLRENALQYMYSAPLPPYVTGAAEAALDLNDRVGEQVRDRLHAATCRLTAGLRELGVPFDNVGGFPVVFWKVGELAQLIAVTREMYDRGVVAGLRAYPVVPMDGCGLRFALTALHTDAQIDRTLEVIGDLTRRHRLARAA
jgi:8-amino-7-oxononanoate synthase